MSTREKIIDSAMAIVRDQGVAKLTLDEAAKVAGISKGGVLYHFKSKDDLIRGMVQRLIDQCDQLNHEYYEREVDGPYRWARAHVHATFDASGPAFDPVGGALLAAVTVNPDLVAPIQVMYDRWMERIKSDSPDLERAGLICTAMDGVFFQRLMGINISNAEGAERLKRHALDLLQ
ncbi:Transcriptional regulator TetR family [Paramagnetospirillum magnetotacticum MS-1]|uniref:Transcriptional regulator TetR family n=1 Tax=Paramagnetospirillum magnetotacticum MS-1 TaxID=272627 RepID=A0A0C2V6G9_PARME|nr:TetR/AcrR family transcriptional regulator [Paramagnetospirillum magnetotacticum]KIM00642.1 Transcriptional regulator TetR family [Paramagnetospirillum magnetotacticum MS-1]